MNHRPLVGRQFGESRLEFGRNAARRGPWWGEQVWAFSRDGFGGALAVARGVPRPQPGCGQGGAESRAHCERRSGIRVAASRTKTSCRRSRVSASLRVNWSRKPNSAWRVRRTAARARPAGHLSPNDARERELCLSSSRSARHDHLRGRTRARLSAVTFAFLPTIRRGEPAQHFLPFHGAKDPLTPTRHYVDFALRNGWSSGADNELDSNYGKSSEIRLPLRREKADGDGSMKPSSAARARTSPRCPASACRAPGFTITTEVCTYYYQHKKAYPKELDGQTSRRRLHREDHGHQVRRQIRHASPGLRPLRRARLDARHDGHDSEPRLNDETVLALVKATNNERFAWTATAASSRCTATSSWRAEAARRGS